jgi:putative membrane protein
MPTVPLAVSTDTAAALQLVPLAMLALLYARRTHTLAASAQPLPRWRVRCFYGGIALIAIALISLARISRERFFMHMLEDLLLGDIAALLIVLGLTAPLLAPLQHIGLFGRLRVLQHPALAFALWAIDLYAWHLAVLYEAALRHAGIQALEHALLLLCAINMWMCLFGPLASPGWFGNRAKLIYILAVRIAGAVLGNIILWSGTVFYPYYLKGDAHFHISPLADQSIGGAIMLIEESIVTLCLFYWLFLRATREGEERRANRQLQLAGSSAQSRRRQA